MAEIRVERLHKAFQGFVAVQNSSFVVEDRSFFVMLGPSGCGKTTTLRMIAGLELPTDGPHPARRQGRHVQARLGARHRLRLPALRALPAHERARNIAFPLVSMGMKRADVTARVEEAARILRITELLDRSVSGLSGGDRQRVALGRAIVRRPMAFMMDEPLGALDSELRHVMCGELRGLHDRLNATTIYVTHDQTEAMSLGDKIAVMNHGVIEQFGTPREIYDRPASVFVADFIGSPPMNLLTFADSLEPGWGSVRVGQAEIAVPAPREAVTRRDLILGVRPEHVRLSDGARLRGEVFGTEYLGTTQIVTITTAHGMAKARLAASVKVSIGDAVGLEFRPERISLFDAGSGRAIRTALHDHAQALEAAHV